MSRIAVALDRYGGWHDRLLASISDHRLDGELVDLDCHDWIDRIRGFDTVIWKSPVMGPVAAARFKEKVFVLESHLGKLVFPSYKTIWHFESKIAQSYLFQLENVPTPATVASFEYHDAVACLDRNGPPYVFKSSDGAGGSGVRLVRSRRRALKELQQVFAHQLAHAATATKRGVDLVTSRLRLGTRAWMRHRVVQELLGREKFDAAYWQEFVPDNDSDLRVTVIGGRYAVAFWRQNRAGDFRASGSGKIDYARPVPEDVVRACVELSRRMDFDSMAYDVLFRASQFLITEMSYGFVDRAVAAAHGVYELEASGSLMFRPGSTWPQELWVRALKAKLERQR